MNISKIIRYISNVFGIISLVSLAFLMVAITLDVFVRTIWDQPISGVFELSEIALVLIVFLGLGWTQEDDGHIRVDALINQARPSLRKYLNSISWAFAAAALAFLAWPATLEAINSFEIREFRWGHIQFSIWWAKILLASGLWYAAVHMFIFSVASLFKYKITAEE